MNACIFYMYMDGWIIYYYLLTIILPLLYLRMNEGNNN